MVISLLMANYRSTKKNKSFKKITTLKKAGKVTYVNKKLKKQKKEEKEKKDSVVPAGVPQTVREYYQLVTAWARKNGAVPFIIPLVKEKYKKERFSELTLPEAKAFYESVDKMVAAMQEKDDAALMDGVG